MTSATPDGFPGYPGFAPLRIPDNDPGFQPPREKLGDPSALKARARIIYREVPNVGVQLGWSPKQIRQALADLAIGVFDFADQLDDTICGDSRVQSAMQSRSGALLSKPVLFKEPKRHSDQKLARRCRRVFEEHWHSFDSEAAVLYLIEKAASLGFAYSQIIWDTTGKYLLPYVQNFSARYGYYHWTDRVHIAVTQDGPVPITPGDGKWVLHAPYGAYRGWFKGALRAVAMWVLARQYALRDWSRYSERHGYPALLADTPFGADPDDIDSFTTSLSNFGQENTIQLPGSPSPAEFGKYDVRYLEASDRNWQTFKELISQCNEEITLSYLGQNLTTQVEEGSFAAARVHAHVLQTIVEREARALQRTVYTQIARPFAALNFGDPDLAPQVVWNVQPVEDLNVKARSFQSLAMAVYQLKLAGLEMKYLPDFMKRFGIGGLDVEEVQPLQVEAQVARATGEADSNDSKDSDG